MTRARATMFLATVLVVATGVVLPTDASAGHSPRTWVETRPYSMGEVGPLLAPSCGHGVGGGWVCLGSPGADRISLAIKDDSGRRVGAILVVRDNNGDTLMSRPFCGKSGSIRLVPGWITVHLDAPGDVRNLHWYGGPGCTEIEPVGATQGATTGHVIAKFTKG